MKITDYTADLTRREGGKVLLDVAQVAEVLKLINKDLWGIPYLLIRLLKKKA